MSAGNAICSVSNYILSYHKNFDELMKSVCRSRLASHKSENGFTFIVPDSATVDKYLSSVKKSTNAELLEMQSFCEKHFLYGNVKTHSGSSIINAQGKHLNIKGTTLSDGTNSVELKEVNVTFPSRSVDASGKSKVPNISIYEQVNSANGIHKLKPMDTPSTKSLTVTTKKGGALYTRNDIIKNVMRIYCLNQSVHKNHNGFLNPFSEAVNSLLLCLRKHNNSLYKNILMIKDVSPEINFFMLVKSFGSKKEMLVSNELIAKWGGTLFDYKPKTLNRLFDLEAHQLISANSELLSLQDKTDDFYNKLSSITGFSAEAHMAIDKFRSIFRKKLHDMVNTPDPLVELRVICDEIQVNTSSNITPRIMGGMESTGSCCYLNNLMVYDENTGSAMSVSQNDLPKISNDNTHSEHFIEGFKMLNSK